MVTPKYLSRVHEILQTRTTDRLGYLVAQLDTAWEILQHRLQGLTNDEYLWEPVPGCWSVPAHRDHHIPPIWPRGVRI
jgi:hypothetical protein